MKLIISLTLLLIVIGCSPKMPMMSAKASRETFQPILDLMEYKPGMTVADVGAGSGAETISMASLMNNSVVYIQDIDTTVLSNSKVEKMLNYFQKQNGTDLRDKNQFKIVIGTYTQTNLADGSLDLIYSNATAHVFSEFDAMMTDISKKLKPDGKVFFRDSFYGDHGEGEKCSDPKCGNKLLTIDEFKSAMKRNGFELVKESADMSGYPVFGFKKM
jgi:ubiquinone/menaquinone biosynthesis C-methylase UbiE